MKTLPFHPVAELFPLMDGTAFDELVNDIRANGLREPIWTHDGKIIDGRNRYRACKEADVDPKFQEWDGTGDLLAFVLSKNIHRRHLTPSQRAMVAARARDIYDRRAKERMQSGKGTDGSGGRGHKSNPPVKVPEGLAGDSRDLVGKALQVSGSYVDRATKVIENGTPELIKAVDEGRMAVTTAAVLSTEPPEVQMAECASPRRNRTYESLSAPIETGEEREDRQPTNGTPRPGVGIDRANEAINCLIRIPKNDALRKRGFQLVTDWIRRNK